MKDVVIVGGGIAGLAAGWRLRHWDTVLLESETRVGGRVRSERRGPYFMNWGGHVYAGGNSSTAWLLNDTGVDSVAVPGSLSGLAMNGKLLLKGRIESYPFRVPMSWSSRMEIMKTGAKVSLAVARYAKIVGLRRGEDEATRQQRVYNFMNDRSVRRLHRRPARGCGGPVQTHRDAFVRGSRRDLGRSRRRLFQPRVEYRSRSEPEHRRRTIDPDRKHRSCVRRSRATEFDGRRDRAQEELRRGPLSPGRIGEGNRGTLRRARHACDREPPGRR